MDGGVNRIELNRSSNIESGFLKTERKTPRASKEVHGKRPLILHAIL